MDARPSVAVMFIENNTSRDGFGNVIRSMLERNLSQSDQLSVTSNLRIKDILRQVAGETAIQVSEQTVTRVAEIAGVESMFLGSVVQMGGVFRLDVDLIDAKSGRLVGSDYAMFQHDSLVFGAIDQLTAAMLTGIGFETSIEPGELLIRDVATSSLTAYEYYEKGWDAINGWRWDEGLGHFKTAIALDSTFTAAYIGAARAASWFSANPLDNLLEGKRYLQLAQRHSGGATAKERQVLDYLSVALAHQDEAEAIRKLRDLADTYPDDKVLQFMDANRGPWRGSAEVRYTYYNRALDLDPTLANVYGVKIYAALVAQDYEEAVSSARRYRELMPDISHSFDVMWTALTNSGRHADAISFVNEAIATDPEMYENKRWHLAYNKILSADTTGISDILADVLAWNPIAGLRTRVGVAVAAGQWDRARTYSAAALRESRRTSTEGALTMHLLTHASVLHMQGDHEAAEEFVDEAIELSASVFSADFNPIPIIAKTYNGLAYADEGDLEKLKETIADVELALQEPGFDERHASFLYTMKGFESLLEGDFDSAENYLDRIVGMHYVYSNEVFFLRAGILAGRGELAEAESILEHARNAMIGRFFMMSDFTVVLKNHSLTSYRIARMYDDAGDLEKARRWYVNALDRWEAVGADFRFVDIVRKRLNNLN